jgi:hypothetical protein
MVVSGLLVGTAGRPRSAWETTAMRPVAQPFQEHSPGRAQALLKKLERAMKGIEGIQEITGRDSSDSLDSFHRR